MTKRIPVYEQTIVLGNETVTFLSTTPTRKWKYDYYDDDKPIGYLELLEEES